jgi:heme-degrading monooxygenase HmoA
VIEIRLSGSGGIEQLDKAAATAFDKLSPPQGFLGYFSGPKHGDSGRFVVVTKWSSKQFIDDTNWVKESEELLLGALGSEAQVVSRLQMYS